MLSIFRYIFNLIIIFFCSVEEKPYKHEHYNPDIGNYKGTPYIDEGSYKGSPFPSGIGGGHKGTPYPSGISGGEYKGTPYPSGFGGGEYKGSPYPESLGGGNKGTSYIPSGKGSGGSAGSGGYHSKGSNVNPTSAQAFLAAHADKLGGGQSGGEYGNILASYSHQQHSGYQGLGGGIHGGLQNHQGYQTGGYQNSQGGYHESFGSYGGQGQTGYDLHSLASLAGYDNVYGRGVDTNKIHEEGNTGVEQSGGYESERSPADHTSGSGGEESYGKHSNDDKIGQQQKEAENQGGAGYNAPAYIGVSVTSYDDHSGRGGGYPENTSSGKYDGQTSYDSHAGETRDQGSESQGYQGYNANADYNSQSNGVNYAHQGNSANYVQLPQLALYQIQNGAATAITYPTAGLQIYNAGYQGHSGYQNQDDTSYDNNQVGNGNYDQQSYQQQEGSDDNSQGNYQQQNAYGYQGQANYNAEGYQSNQGYGNQQSQDSTGYGTQEGLYGSQNQDGYNAQGNNYQNQEAYSNQANSEAYQNQASYQVNQNSGGYQNEAAGYGGQEIAAGLQHYGLRAAYPVQTGVENNNQLQGATGAVYVRAYNQGENQASYNNQNEENYQTQDSQQQKSYTAYSVSSSTSVKTAQKPDAQTQQIAAAGRTYDSKTNDQIVGNSSGYSTPEGGDTKGGSWQGVQ